MTSTTTPVGNSLGSPSAPAAGARQSVAGPAAPLLLARPEAEVRPIRRILFIGKSKSTSGTTRAIVDGLRTTGVAVHWTNCARLQRLFGPRLMRAAVRRTFERLQPDLLVTFYCDVPPDLLAEFHPRCRTMMWNEEWNAEPARAMQPWLAHIDLLCLNNKAQADVYRGLGARRVEFVMSGFSPRVHYPSAWRGEPLYDLCYIGSMSPENPRGELILKLAERHDVHVFGRGWETLAGKSRRLHVHGRVDPRRFARVCAQSRVMLGANWVNTVPYYFSNRTWMTLGSRAFHLTHYVPGLEHVFENRRHLVWYEDLGELLELLRAYLPDAAARERIAGEGYALVREHHTYGHRMQEALALLGHAAPLPMNGLASHAGKHAGTNGAVHGASNGTPSGAVLVPLAPRLGAPAPATGGANGTTPPRHGVHDLRGGPLRPPGRVPGTGTAP